MFKVLRQLTSVNDPCEPFIGEFDKFKNVESIWKEWPIDLYLVKIGASNIFFKYEY